MSTVPGIITAKARHDVLSVVLKGLKGTGMSKFEEILAVEVGLHAMQMVIDDMKCADIKLLEDKGKGQDKET